MVLKYMINNNEDINDLILKSGYSMSRDEYVKDILIHLGIIDSYREYVINNNDKKLYSYYTLYYDNTLIEDELSFIKESINNELFFDGIYGEVFALKRMASITKNMEVLEYIYSVLPVVYEKIKVINKLQVEVINRLEKNLETDLKLVRKRLKRNI